MCFWATVPGFTVSPFASTLCSSFAVVSDTTSAGTDFGPRFASTNGSGFTSARAWSTKIFVSLQAIFCAYAGKSQTVGPEFASNVAVAPDKSSSSSLLFSASFTPSKTVDTVKRANPSKPNSVGRRVGYRLGKQCKLPHWR